MVVRVIFGTVQYFFGCWNHGYVNFNITVHAMYIYFKDKFKFTSILFFPRGRLFSKIIVHCKYTCVVYFQYYLLRLFCLQFLFKILQVIADYCRLIWRSLWPSNVRSKSHIYWPFNKPIVLVWRKYSKLLDHNLEYKTNKLISNYTRINDKCLFAAPWSWTVSE